MLAEDILGIFRRCDFSCTRWRDLKSRQMERTYYSVRYRLDKQERYLIWFTTADECLDGVVVNQDATIPVFVNEMALLKFAEGCGFKPEESSASSLHNLDVIVRFLKDKRRLRSR